MVNKIPTYTPETTIKPSVGNEDNSFSQWANDFAGLTKQINNQRGQDIDFDTIEEAKQAGSSPDFKEEEPLTKEDRLYERQALQSNEVALSNQIRTKALDMRDYFSQPGHLTPTSGQDFKVQMSSYLSNVVDTAPDGSKEYLRNMGERYISSIGETLNFRSQALAKSNLRFNLEEYINSNVQTAMQSAMSGDSSGAINAAAMFGQIHRKVVSAVSSGYMSAQQAEMLLKQSKSQIQQSSIIGKFRLSMKNGDGEQALLDFMESPPKDMDLIEVKQSISLMSGMLQTAQNMGKIKSQLIAQQSAALFNSVANGQTDLTSGDVSEAYQNSQADGSGDAFNNGLSKASIENSIKTATRFIPPYQAEAIASNLISKLNTSDPDYQEKVDSINMAKEASYKNWNIFKSDPAKYSLTSPVVQAAAQAANIKKAAPFTSSGVSVGSYFIDPSIAPAMIAQQKQMGAQENPTSSQIPQISLIPKETAKNLAAALNSMPVQDQVELLKGLMGKAGSSFGIYMRDLKNGGYSLGSQWAVSSILVNPAAQFDIINSQRLTNKDYSGISADNKNSLNESIESLMSDYNQSYSNYSMPSSQTLSQAHDFVQRLAMYYLYSGKTSSPSGAASMAYNSTISKFVNFTSIDGSVIRIPAGVQGISSSDIKREAEKQIKDNIKKSYDFIYNKQLLSGEQKEDYINNLLSNGKYVTLPDNSGIIFVDQSGNPVRIKKDGKVSTLFLKFRDIQAINQSLYPVTKQQKSFGGMEDFLKND